MNTIYEHFEEKLLSLSMELDGAIMRRLTQEHLALYRNICKTLKIEDKLQYLKELEK